MLRLSPFVSLVAVVAGLSCVLVVPSRRIADHCELLGAATECGACLTARCQSEVDACCGDPTCEATDLRTIEQCAATGGPACSVLSDASRNPRAATATRCAATQCAGYCAAKAPGRTQTFCREPAGAAGAACACKVDPASANAFACSAEVIAGTLCCAPGGWPAAGLECDCLPMRCTPTTGGCFCDRVDYTLPGATATCKGLHCCANAQASCECSARECGPSEREVSACSIENTVCPTERAQVASCSFSLP
jgi:hypothetical protein